MDPIASLAKEYVSNIFTTYVRVDEQTLVAIDYLISFYTFLIVSRASTPQQTLLQILDDMEIRPAQLMWNAMPSAPPVSSSLCFTASTASPQPAMQKPVVVMEQPVVTIPLDTKAQGPQEVIHITKPAPPPQAPENAPKGYTPDLCQEWVLDQEKRLVGVKNIRKIDPATHAYWVRSVADKSLTPKQCLIAIQTSKPGKEYHKVFVHTAPPDYKAKSYISGILSGAMSYQDVEDKIREEAKEVK